MLQLIWIRLNIITINTIQLKNVSKFDNLMYSWFPGNLVDWWYPATKDKYMQKAQCIIQQYGNYTIDELGVSLNGINTQGENIADNGGIKEAYQAYSKYPVPSLISSFPI